MEFELKTKHGKLLQNIVDIASNVTDETELIVTNKGVLLTSADPGRICIIYITIPKSIFENFELEGNQKEVPISLDTLGKVLSRISQKDNLTLKYDEKKQILVVQLQKEKGQIKTFSVKTITHELEKLDVNLVAKMEYENKVVIPVDTLIDAINDATIYNDAIDIGVNPESGLSFGAVSSLGDMKNEIDLSMLKEHLIKNTANSTYAMKYLQQIKKLSSIIDKMTLHLKSDFPIKIVFDLKEGIKLFFYMAPRVEQNF